MSLITKVIEFVKKMLAIQVVKYLITGGTTFSIDFIVLVLLHGVLDVNLVLAATVSYWLSIIFNFTVNRLWTFNAKEKSDLAKHAILYSAILGFNYAFTVLFIVFATHVVKLPYTVAKVFAVALQITWTYPIYKRFIFVSTAKVKS